MRDGRGEKEKGNRKHTILQQYNGVTCQIPIMNKGKRENVRIQSRIFNNKLRN